MAPIYARSVTLLITLKMYLSVEITLEVIIQNKFSKSLKFSKEISVPGFIFREI